MVSMHVVNNDFLDTLDFGKNFIVDGKVTQFSDDSFADVKSLLKVDDPAFDPGTFDPEAGQIYDGWETRRHNTSLPDWAIIKLAKAEKIGCIIVDSKWFDGNHPQMVGLLVSRDGKEWIRLMVPKLAIGHARHIFDVTELGHMEFWKYIKLEMYPDGGIARLRAYENVPEDLKIHFTDDVMRVRHREEILKPSKEPFVYPDVQSILDARNNADVESDRMNLASLEYGSRIVGTSNERYSHAANLLKSEASANMGDGWENARYRPDISTPLVAGWRKKYLDALSKHSEYVDIALGAAGKIDEFELNFRFFNFNNPMSVKIEGKFVEPGDDVANVKWETLLDKIAVKEHAGAIHRFRPNVHGNITVNYLRYHIYPCGGSNRLKAKGKFDSWTEMSSDP